MQSLSDLFVWLGCLLVGHGPTCKCRDMVSGEEYEMCLLCNERLTTNPERART